MRKIILIALTVVISGCTGTNVIVSPEVAIIDPVVNSNQYSALGISEPSSSQNFGEVGNIPKEFSLELKKSGLSQEVYYPMRSEDKVDYELVTHFTVKSDNHSGATFTKGFFVGMTFFIFEPFIWFDIDYTILGNIDIMKDGNKIQSISAQSKATASMKWLSLSEVGRLKGEAILKARQSIINQLINKIYSL